MDNMEIQWGKMIFNLVFPLLLAMWLMYLIRHKAIQHRAERPAGLLMRLLTYAVGFVITASVAVFLGSAILAQVEPGAGELSRATELAAMWLSLAAVFVSGLCGALVPFRMLAREGKGRVWTWLGLGLVYAVLFWVFAEAVRA
jgi:hypothetical protein